MNANERMWVALAWYQRFAERHGFGAEWLRMTTERTEDAANAARAGAVACAYATAGVRVGAEWAEWAAAWAALALEAAQTAKSSEDSETLAERAIAFITRAIELENEQ